MIHIYIYIILTPEFCQTFGAKQQIFVGSKFHRRNLLHYAVYCTCSPFIFCKICWGCSKELSPPKRDFPHMPFLKVLGTMLGQVLREPEARVQVRQVRRSHFSVAKMTSKGLSLGSFFYGPILLGILW